MTTQAFQNLYAQGGGTTSSSPFLPVISTDNPTTSSIKDATGFFTVGKRWINKSSNISYTLTSLTSIGAAVTATWVEDGTGTGALDKLNGNSGTALPSGGAITIAGTTPISTTATGSTVTITSIAVDSVTANTGSATPSSNVISIVGTAPLATTGSGSTITIAHGGPEIVQPWTPTLAFGGSSTGITYNVRTGSYLQVGPVVFFTIFINLSSKGAQVGNATITNVPVAGGVAYSQYVGEAGFWDKITLDANFTQVTWEFNLTTLLLLEAGSGQAMTQLTNANFANDSILKITGFYMTN